jgi:hypothetical protein
MNPRQLFHWIFNFWVIGGAILFAGLLFGIVMLLLFVSRPSPAQSVPSTAVMIVIPAPTATVLLPSPTPEQQITPTPSVPPPPPDGTLAIGAFVQIYGTGGDGLNVRNDPGLNGKVLFLALEAEVFQVTEGPKEVDGYTWWHLVAPYDHTRQGWAASNYLAVVQPP